MKYMEKRMIRSVILQALIACVVSAFVACSNGSQCEHVFGEWQETRAATCTLAGERRRVCSVCDKEVTEAVATLEHTLTVLSVTAPTCIRQGYTEYGCSVCGMKQKREIVSALGHNMSEWARVTDASCFSNGGEERYCIICSHEETRVIPRLEHDYGSPEYISPTCKSEGYTRRVCSRCGDTYADTYVPTLAHIYGEYAVILEPTCTREGVKERVCVICEEKDTSPIQALEHDYRIADSVMSDCSSEGYNIYSCVRCADSYREGLEKLPHTFSFDAAVPATCTSNGKTEGVHCSVCNSIIVMQEETPMLPHNTVKLPGEEATCTSTGKTEGLFCNMCQQIFVAQSVIPMLPHDRVTDPAIAATCTSTGSTEGARCAVCKTVIVVQQTLPKLPHREVTDPHIDPTCAAAGKTEGTHCLQCGRIIVPQHAIPKLPHTEVIDPKVEPTCTKEGMTAGMHCAGCGLVFVAQETLAKIPHAYANDTWKCRGCGKPETAIYSTYNEFAAVCDVSESDNIVTVTYNMSDPANIDLSSFGFNERKNYIFVFGESAGKVRMDGCGRTFSNLMIRVAERPTAFSLLLYNLHLINPETVLTSQAKELFLSFYGVSCSIATQKGSDGNDGTYSAFPLDASLNGTCGGNASVPMVIDGKLNIVCGARTTIRAGDGGKGGNGADCGAYNSVGGNGGNGGNGVYAIKADSVMVLLEKGIYEEDVLILGGKGGDGGLPGCGTGAFLGVSGKMGERGRDGVAAKPSDVTIYYIQAE